MEEERWREDYPLPLRLRERVQNAKAGVFRVRTREEKRIDFSPMKP